jgi:large subunit ribosomal protein L24
MKVWSKFWKSSTQKRKQRKYQFKAPLHIKHRFMNSVLSKELRKEYGIRSLPVRKGDVVTVMTGDSKGTSGKVEKVSLARTKVFVEGVTVSKADGTKVMYPVHPSNLKITKLDLSDKKRQDKVNKIKKEDDN